MFIFSLASFVSCAQSFLLFPPEAKTEYPNIVYDFVERYLYVLDSLDRDGVSIIPRMRDDNVYILEGDPSIFTCISPQTPFTMTISDDQYYRVLWTDSIGRNLLDMVFPVQYELLLGKSKRVAELELKKVLENIGTFRVKVIDTVDLQMREPGIWSTEPYTYLYLKSQTSSCYFIYNDSLSFIPIFDSSDNCHSAANLFQGIIDNVSGYSIDISQNFYGFCNEQYEVSMAQWLAYCSEMNFDVYFSVEEERQDDFTVLIIVHSKELGFNHMLSVIIPNDFVNQLDTHFKATLNAYIPTHNIKNIYQITEE